MKTDIIKNNKIWRILIAIYSVVLFGMNFVRIFDNTFWGDECFTLKMVGVNFAEMMDIIINDVHPPFYYFVFVFLVKIFGQYPWAYHLTSIVFYGIFLIVLQTLVYKKWGPAVTLFMITLISLQPEAVGFNVEVRMYSLVVLFVFVAYYGMYMILKDSTKKSGYIVFIIFSLLAAYTHYYALLAVAIFYCGLLVACICKRLSVKNLIITYVVTIIGYIPWTFKMFFAITQTAEDHWQEEYPRIKECLTYFYVSNNRTFTRGMFILTVLLIAVLVVLELKKQKKLSVETVWLMWGVIAAVAVICIGQIVCVLIRPVFLKRYLYPLVPVFWLVTCVGLSKVKWGNIINIVLTVIMLALFIPSYISISEYEKEEDIICQETVEKMRQLVGEGDMVITDVSHFGWTVFDYYLPGIKAYYVCDESDYVELDDSKNYCIAWSEDVPEDIVEWINKCGYEISEEMMGGNVGTYGVNVYRMEK